MTVIVFTDLDLLSLSTALNQYSQGEKKENHFVCSHISSVYLIFKYTHYLITIPAVNVQMTLGTSHLSIST